MTTVSSRAPIALLLSLIALHALVAQDTSHTIHRVPVDTTRLRSFQRAYDMIVRTGDSVVVIGERRVAFDTSTYSGSRAWLMTETRSGSVPSSESLFVATNFRPLHWSAALGLARLGAEFVGDSIYGAITTPASKQNLVLDDQGDLLPNAAYVETLLSTLPLNSGWRDSVTVAQIGATTCELVRAELNVVGEEDVGVDSSGTRPAWVVALRSDSTQILYWIDKSDGALVRLLQQVPAHVGSDVELRLKRRSVPDSAP